MAEKRMRIIEPRSTNGAMLVHGKPIPMAVVKSASTSYPTKRTRRQRLKELELRGEVRLGSGRLPDGFWAMPLPCDSEGSVRQALTEDRR